MDTPRIYVACLASYNAGTLHGKWIDASGGDEIRAEVAEMLRQSPYPNVAISCPDCPTDAAQCPERTCMAGNPCVHECPTCKGRGKVASAEEWAIHDYEGFGGLKLSEYESFDTVAELATLIEEHGPAYVAYRDYVGAGFATASGFEESYQGNHEDEEAFGAQLYEDMYGDPGESDHPLASYLHAAVDRWSHDLFYGGDYWSAKASAYGDDTGIYVFSSN